MAARKGPGFRRTLRQSRTDSLAGQSFCASMMVDDTRRAEQEQRIASERAAIAPKRERAAPRKLEAPVVAAISELLAVHPRVIWAARFNSGSAVAASGAPVWFHKMLRMPAPMRMPDFFGLYRVMRKVRFLSVDGIRRHDDPLAGEPTKEHHQWQVFPLAIEAKAPGWTHPKDAREREQAAFLSMIRSAGGIGIFACSVDDVAKALA